MWPHEIQFLSSWYTVIALFLITVFITDFVNTELKFSRFYYLGDIAALSWVLALVTGGVLLIVTISHPVEISLFYLFILSFVASLLTFIPALFQKIKKYPPSSQLVCQWLHKALKGEDLEQIKKLLNVLRDCIEVDEEILLRALCDRRSKIRKHAANVATKFLDKSFTDCIQGKANDFEKLAEINDNRTVHLLNERAEALLARAEFKKGEKRIKYIASVLGCFKASDIPDQIAQRIVKAYETSKQHIKKSILNKLFQLEDKGAKICEALLSSPNDKVRSQVAKAFWVASRQGTLNIVGAWESVGRLFWENYQYLIAQDLCSKKASRRKGAAKLGVLFGAGEEYIKNINGRETDFVHLARSGQPWILEQLVIFTKSIDEEEALNAIQGISGLLEDDTIPVSLIKMIGKMTNEDHSPSLVSSGSEFVSVSNEIRNDVKVLLGARVEEGLFSEKSSVRLSMVRPAINLGMDARFQDVIKGDINDFQRIADLGEPEYDDRLALISNSVRFSENEWEALPGIMKKEIENKSLKQATIEGDVELVKRLIKLGVNVDDTDGSELGTSMHTAARDGRVDIAKLLINAGADINRKNGDMGATPLMIAVDSGQDKMVKFLVEQGANKSLTNHDGATALTYAKFTYKNKRKVITSILSDKDDRNSKTSSFTKEQAIKELITECEWHIVNAHQYYDVKDEFKRREEDIVRPIGEKLHQAGGLELMRDVYQEVEKAIFNRYQKGCGSALEMKWSGIGDWR